MVTITDILVQKNNKDRVNIYIDYDYALSCSLELVFKESLKKGMKLDKEELNDLVSLDNYIKCKNKALKIIEKTYKTEKEISNKLLEFSYDEETISKVMEFLKNYNFVDDSRYAKLYVSEKKKSRGVLKIILELRKKGIDEEIISEVAKVDFEEGLGYAMEASFKKYHNFKSHGDPFKSITSKIYTYLKTLGYEDEIINEVLNTLKGEYYSSVTDVDTERLKERISKEAIKKYNALIKKSEDLKYINKDICNFLCRKGYDLDIVIPIVNEIINNKEMG